jgi:hypothetical protein
MDASFDMMLHLTSCTLGCREHTYLHTYIHTVAWWGGTVALCIYLTERKLPEERSYFPWMEYLSVFHSNYLLMVDGNPWGDSTL